MFRDRPIGDLPADAHYFKTKSTVTRSLADKRRASEMRILILKLLALETGPDGH